MPKKQAPSFSEGIIMLSILLVFAIVLYMYNPPAKNTNTVNQPTQVANNQNAQANQPQEEQAVDPAQLYAKLTITQGDRIWGKKDGVEISVVEFVDFECPFCKRIKDYPHKIVQEYGDKVNWVFKNLPLSFHEPYATREAMFVECAADLFGMDAYMKLHDKIFEGEGKYSEEQLLAMAKDAGLDTQKLGECVKQERFKDKIQADLQLAQTVGAQGTPTMIVMDHKDKKAILIPGAVPYESLKEQIDSMLND